MSGSAVTAHPMGGPLTTYLAQLRATALLTVEQERSLSQAVRRGQEAQKRRDQGRATESDLVAIKEAAAAKDHFIRANLRLVVSVARRYPLSEGMELLDLIQEGNLGLEPAVDKFDGRKGFKFSTYAVHWIRKSIELALRQKGSLIRIPEYRDAQMRAELRAHGGDYRSVSPETARLYQLARPASLDEPLHPSSDLPLSEFIADGDSLGPEEELMARVDLGLILELLRGCLTDRQAYIVTQRFGLTGEAPRSPADIGRDLDLSAGWVRKTLDLSFDAIRAHAAGDRTLLSCSYGGVPAAHEDPPQDEGTPPSLVSHGETVLQHLTRWDKRWSGEVVLAAPHRVVLNTTWDGTVGPGMRIADTSASPADQAFVLHESVVGGPTARRDRTDHEELQRQKSDRAKAKQERRNARRRERWANDPEWRDEQNAKARARLANDPERHDRQNAKAKKRQRERWANDPEWRDEQNAKARARRASDTEWREQQNARRRELWANDPDRREKGECQGERKDAQGSSAAAS